MLFLLYYTRNIDTLLFRVYTAFLTKAREEASGSLVTKAYLSQLRKELFLLHDTMCGEHQKYVLLTSHISMP